MVRTPGKIFNIYCSKGAKSLSYIQSARVNKYSAFRLFGFGTWAHTAFFNVFYGCVLSTHVIIPLIYFPNFLDGARSSLGAFH